MKGIWFQQRPNLHCNGPHVRYGMSLHPHRRKSKGQVDSEKSIIMDHIPGIIYEIIQTTLDIRNKILPDKKFLTSRCFWSPTQWNFWKKKFFIPKVIFIRFSQLLERNLRMFLIPQVSSIGLKKLFEKKNTTAKFWQWQFLKPEFWTSTAQTARKKCILSPNVS